MESYYDILGVVPSSSAEEIRTAYRRLAFELHPDRAGSATSQREELLRVVNEAFAVLGNPAKRAEYDVLHGGKPLEVEMSPSQTLIPLAVPAILPVLLGVSVGLSEELGGPIGESLFFTWAAAIGVSWSAQFIPVARGRFVQWGVLAAGVLAGGIIFYPRNELYDFLFFLKATLAAVGAASLAKAVGEKLTARWSVGATALLTLALAAIAAPLLTQLLGMADPDGSLIDGFLSARQPAETAEIAKPEELAVTVASQWAAAGAVLASVGHLIFGWTRK